ncbi:MAG: hypothetical protein ACI87E_000648 [Mariniblastus sp.]|jgi:hypothetical protein
MDVAFEIGSIIFGESCLRKIAFLPHGRLFLGVFFFFAP